MKHNIKHLMMLLFISTICLGFTSCSDDDDEPTNPSSYSIVGTWFSDYFGYDEVLVLEKNGTGTYTTSVEGIRIVEDLEYSYSDTDDLLTIMGSSLQGRYYVLLGPSKLGFPLSGGGYQYFVRQ